MTAGQPQGVPRSTPRNEYMVECGGEAGGAAQVGWGASGLWVLGARQLWGRTFASSHVGPFRARGGVRGARVGARTERRNRIRVHVHTGVCEASVRRNRRKGKKRGPRPTPAVMNEDELFLYSTELVRTTERWELGEQKGILMFCFFLFYE